MKNPEVKPIPIGVEAEAVPYEPAIEYYGRTTQGGNHLGMLLESRRRDMIYGTKTVIVTKPGLQVLGTGDQFEVRALSEAGASLLEPIAQSLSGLDRLLILTANEDHLVGRVAPQTALLPEKERLKQVGLGRVVRQMLSTFTTEDQDAGLYGLFGYDCIRQTENIGSRHKRTTPDINLILPLEVVVFDEMKQSGLKKSYGLTPKATQPAQAIPSPLSFGQHPSFHRYDLSDEQYMQAVRNVVQEIAEGEMIQAVLSRLETVGLVKHPLESYHELTALNPSPYCFFYNLGGDEAVFGASPEMHVRVQSGKVELHPLAGTRRRKGNAVDDFYVRQSLLNDPKEGAEHTMLVDLGRNDLSRVCTNVQVSRFMDIVEFPNLYHIGSSITGTLREGMDAIDALFATSPQGTLSGAPKVRAMQSVEQYEGSARGYYGGCVGTVGFNGDCNTAIVIRSIHSKAGYGMVRAGAGVVLDSSPQGELAEVNLKNANQLRALGGGNYYD